MQEITSLHAGCVYACHLAHNLFSPGIMSLTLRFKSRLVQMITLVIILLIDNDSTLVLGATSICSLGKRIYVSFSCK